MLNVNGYIGKTLTFAKLSENQKATERRAINNLLSSYAVSVTRCIESPRMIQYRAELPPDCNINKILKLQPNLCIALSDDTVNLYREKSELVIEKRGADNKIRLGDVFIPQRMNDIHLPLMLGKDMEGNNVYTKLAKAPHILIAGTTGSGKSVFLHSIICSLLIADPYTRIYTVDTKKTEFAAYSRVPTVHTITEAADAVRMLSQLCAEMEERYDVLEKYGCRDIEELRQKNVAMRRIVVVIDEFADLMGLSAASVERYVVRLAQKARACGIHLVIATQRPTREVVTGLIKSNMPTRICLKVTSGIDSRIILDRKGGEVLTGNGDMLFLGNGAFEPIRIQGCYLEDREIENIANLASNYVRAQAAQQAEADRQRKDRAEEARMDRIKARKEAAQRQRDRELWEREQQQKRSPRKGPFEKWFG